MHAPPAITNVAKECRATAASVGVVGGVWEAAGGEEGMRRHSGSGGVQNGWGRVWDNGRGAVGVGGKVGQGGVTYF